jgi:hypothetical protein
MPGPSAPPSGRGYGRFDFRDGTSDQGSVTCFQFDAPNAARFTITVAKGSSIPPDPPDKYLLVQVMDNGNGTSALPLDTLGYTRLQTQPDCTKDLANPPGPVMFGNIVVSDGSQQ